MALSITSITDNANSTATVVLGGVPVGADLNFFTSDFGDSYSSTWTSRASVVGSAGGTETFNISPGVGFHFGYAVITNLTPQVTAPAYFVVSSGTSAVLKQLQVAIQSRIQLLSLSGVPGSSVVVRKLPYDRNLTPPAVIVSPQPETYSALAGTNLRDDVNYGVLVSLYQASNQDLSANQDRFLLWRQQVFRAFRNQRIPGVAESINTTVEPKSIVLPEGFAAQFDVQALLIRCTCREIRGLT